jgi:hypothetical protein
VAHELIRGLATLARAGTDITEKTFMLGNQGLGQRNQRC